MGTRRFYSIINKVEAVTLSACLRPRVADFASQEVFAITKTRKHSFAVEVIAHRYKNTSLHIQLDRHMQDGQQRGL